MRYSRHEIERIARRAFEAARLRRRRVTSVDKANVLETSRLWRQVVTAVAQGLSRRHARPHAGRHLRDEARLRAVIFDVILTENMFGDILSDEAGAIVGSLGLLPSASLGDGSGSSSRCTGPPRTSPARDIANPIGAIASAAMLLRYALKLETEAASVEQAIEAALIAGLRTADLAAGGASVSTNEMTDAHRRGAVRLAGSDGRR